MNPKRNPFSGMGFGGMCFDPGEGKCHHNPHETDWDYDTWHQRREKQQRISEDKKLMLDAWFTFWMEKICGQEFSAAMNNGDHKKIEALVKQYKIKRIVHTNGYREELWSGDKMITFIEVKMKELTA